MDYRHSLRIIVVGGGCPVGAGENWGFRDVVVPADTNNAAKGSKASRCFF